MTSEATKKQSFLSSLIGETPWLNSTQQNTRQSKLCKHLDWQRWGGWGILQNHCYFIPIEMLTKSCQRSSSDNLFHHWKITTKWEAPSKLRSTSFNFQISPLLLQIRRSFLSFSFKLGNPWPSAASFVCRHLMYEGFKLLMADLSHSQKRSLKDV